MDILIKELNISNDMLSIAKQKQMEHFNSVNKNYPHLEY
jgi:hypothetical protein